MLKKILKKFEDMNSNTITQDMLVGDIVRLHPEVVDTYCLTACIVSVALRLNRKVWPMPAWYTDLIRKKS